MNDKAILAILLVMYVVEIGLGFLLLQKNSRMKNDSWFFALLVAQLYALYLYNGSD